MRMFAPILATLLVACAADVPDASVMSEALMAKTVVSHPKATINIKAAKKVIKRYDVAIQRCYERALKNKPDLSGNLDLQLLIKSSDGMVEKTSYGPESLQHPAMRTCVERQIKRMKFPIPKGGDIKLHKRYTFLPTKAAKKPS